LSVFDYEHTPLLALPGIEEIVSRQPLIDAVLRPTGAYRQQERYDC
jgi:hypothetical protein